MKPYYQDKYAIIYHGDCLELLPDMPKVDLVLTDPPYGIGADKMNFGKWRSSKMLKTDWDKKDISEHLYMAIQCSHNQIVWGGNYFELPASRMFLGCDCRRA